MVAQLNDFKTTCLLCGQPPHACKCKAAFRTNPQLSDLPQQRRQPARPPGLSAAAQQSVANWEQQVGKMDIALQQQVMYSVGIIRQHLQQHGYCAAIAICGVALEISVMELTT
jgi:hypothetical protein